MAIDWQLASIGTGLIDFEFFIIMSMSIDERRKYENQLLQIYVDNVGHNFSLEEAREAYHQSLWFDVLRQTLYMGHMFHQFPSIQNLKECLEKGGRSFTMGFTNLIKVYSALDDFFVEQK